MVVFREERKRFNNSLTCGIRLGETLSSTVQNSKQPIFNLYILKDEIYFLKIERSVFLLLLANCDFRLSQTSNF